MLNEFLNALNKRAAELGIDASELVKTYTRRFELGLEAGFTEEEIIERFGKVEDLLQANAVVVEKNAEIQYDLKEFIIRIADNCDLNIESGRAFDIEIDNDMRQYYDIITAGNRVVVQRKEEAKRGNRHFDDVTITLPKNYIIKKGEISVVNGDVHCDAIVCEDLSVNCVSADINMDFVKAKKADFSMVSGDLTIDVLAAMECNISTVSGDVDVDEAAIKELSVTTISGDINVTGAVEKVDSSSVSGEISINHKSQKTSLKDALGSIFRF